MCGHVSALSQSAVWRRVIRDAEHVKKWPTEIVLLFVSEKKTKLLSIKIQVSKVIWQEVHVRRYTCVTTVRHVFPKRYRFLWGIWTSSNSNTWFLVPTRVSLLQNGILIGLAVLQDTLVCIAA